MYLTLLLLLELSQDVSQVESTFNAKKVWVYHCSGVFMCDNE